MPSWLYCWLPNKGYSRIGRTIRWQKSLSRVVPGNAIAITPQGGEYEKEPGPDSDKIATPQRLPH
jgi:hypothetical protein